MNPSKCDQRGSYIVLPQKVDGFLPTILPRCKANRGMAEGSRAFPFASAVQNRYCEFLLDKKRFSEHRKRLSNAKPLVDDKLESSRRFANVVNGARNKVDVLQIREGKTPVKDTGHQQEVQVLYINEFEKTFRPFDLYKEQEKRSRHLDSLNAAKRKEEACRISVENLGIYQRLLVQRSSYYHKQYYCTWKAHQDLVTQISKYPHQWKATKSQDIGKLKLPPILDKSKCSNPDECTAITTQDCTQTLKTVSLVNSK